MDAIETAHCDAHLETDVINELDIIQDLGSPNPVSKDVQKEPSTNQADPLIPEVKETCESDSPKETCESDSPKETCDPDSVSTPAIPDDIIINLDDSVEVEPLDEDKTDPLGEIETMKKEITTEVSDNLEKNSKNKSTNDDNLIICIDTDDDDETEIEPKKPEEVSTVDEITATPPVIESKKRTSDELSSPNEKQEQTSNEPPLKISKIPSSIECVNLECPNNPNSTYYTACKFILNFYYVSPKPNKKQFVCSYCIAKSVNKFEYITGAIIQNVPVCDIELPKRADLVEIIDSDEESEPNNNNDADPDEESKKIVFDQELANNFESISLNYKETIKFQQQAEWDDNRLKERQDIQKITLSDLDKRLKELEKLSSKMYSNLYSVNKTIVERRDSIDISDEGELCSSPEIPVSREQRPLAQYPPARNSKKNKNILNENDNMQKIATFWCAVRSKSTTKKHDTWARCRMLELITSYENELTKKKYRVQFLDNLPDGIGIVSGLEIAHNVPVENLIAGTRVIADFNPTKPKGKTYQNLTFRKYLPGVIIEKRSDYNNRRYLVHSDYGHYRYIAVDFVLKIVDQSKAVNLPEIFPHVSVACGALVPVEQNGGWRNAEVTTIDCSIVKVRFNPEKSEEWIYCGSKRWGPVQSQINRAPFSFPRHNTAGNNLGSDENDASSSRPKAVARKSTARKSTHPVMLIRSSSTTSQPSATSETVVPKVHILNDNKIYIDEPPQVSVLRKFTPRNDLTPKIYVPHTCSRQCCLGPKSNLSAYSILTRPLLVSWERQIVKKNKTSKHVIYKSPCGRRLRNMTEIHKYLKMTQNKFNVDNFDFDPIITVMTFYDINKDLCGLFLDDLAEGKEGMPIPVLNAFDDQRPPDLQYSSVRIPTKNVRIDKDPGFLMCCDCTDDCSDKSKCACFQNTIAGAKFRNIMDLPEEDISYKFKRLHNMVQTGIYECNQKCKCNSQCFNRVVQQPIQIKMQLYRTKNRGWGLECLHDIPKGTFICTYVGYLYPEKEANALCLNASHGDEYFAELDYIENVQGLKEGFEPGVAFDDTDDDDDEKNSDSDSDYCEQEQNDVDFVADAAAASKRAIATRSSTQIRPKRSGSGKKGDHTEGNDTLEDEKSTDAKPGTSKSSSSSEDENSSEPKNDLVNLVSDEEITTKTVPIESVVAAPKAENVVSKSIRKLFGPKERVYILDAKQCGNVGRYFNHSCMPNLFVQSVFVDSHDPRFPWVSFFASQTIKAGTELTWNYNYDVGSVPGKVLYCKCGASNCRTRIL